MYMHEKKIKKNTTQPVNKKDNKRETDRKKKKARSEGHMHKS